MITISKNSNTITYSDRFVTCTKNAKYSRERDMPRAIQRLRKNIANSLFTTSIENSSFTIYFKNGIVARSKHTYSNKTKAENALNRYLTFVGTHFANITKIKHS